ncbi:MAG TPA: L,D-transpeptidase [Polyangiaceae bacterium]|nr:L,D-transpeptidase [Polyangiaceae bacterium]
MRRDALWLVALYTTACERAVQPTADANPTPSASSPGAVAWGTAPTAPTATVPTTTAPESKNGLAKARVYIKNRFVFVRPRPDVNADWLGFLWFGASVDVRGAAVPVRGPGCATFYAIEPMGFVCVDEKQATLSADDPVFSAVSTFAPRLSQATPHRYAESLGAELRSQLPGVSSEPPALPTLPAFFHEPRRHLLPLSTVAYVEERQSEGQSWLLSADLLWLKKEQVALYPEITFHGVELGREWRLPLAFFRRAGARRFRRTGPGRFERSEGSFTLHEVVALTDQVEFQRGERFFQTASGDDWLREQDAVLPVPRSVTPWGARVGRVDHTGLGPKDPRQTWIEVSVLGGWLLAFEGTKPVFATLISAGRGGIPQEGKNTLEISATPVGTFPISGKLATITLQAPGEYVHSDVPWTQNFQKPYAIHTAYWHDNWGNLASGGCINVSPIDGKWLFDFTEPKLPAGWHAVRWQPATGAPTLLVVHE